MKISADFTVIPDDFAKAAAPEYFNGGVPVVSFPFYIDDVDPEARYLHWEFVDPDSIPVCGFEWIHWSVANLPIDALMYDFNDSHALAIPPDFSRQLPAMIPETVQGCNSSASKFLGRSTDPAVIMRYNGPQPPDKVSMRVLPAGVGHQEAVARLESGLLAQRAVARAAQQR